MVVVSRNLQVRLNLARESLNHIQVSLANGYTVSKTRIKQVRQELATCRKLLRKELVECNIMDLLPLLTTLNILYTLTINNC